MLREEGEFHPGSEDPDSGRNFRRHLRRFGWRGTGRHRGGRRCGGKSGEKRKQKTRKKQGNVKKKSGAVHGGVGGDCRSR
jgi:hypothetical protein